MLRVVFLPLILLLLLGSAQALSLSLPWGEGQAVWWLQIAATAGLYFVLRGARSVGVAALYGFVFAWAWLGGAVWWLFISLHRYGGLAALWSALSVAALCVFLSLYFAAAAGLYRCLAMRKKLSLLGELVAFSALWLLAELARNSWLTGFPLGASAYAHIDGPLRVYAPYVGVYGMGFCASLLAASLAACAGALLAAWRTRKTTAYARRMYQDLAPAFLIYAGILALLIMTPYLLPPSGAGVYASRPPVRVDLLQGDISQGEKFEPSTGIADALWWYRKSMLESQATISITPETAIPLLPAELPEGYWIGLQRHFAQHPSKAALIGIPLGDMERGYANAVVGLKASEAATHYHYSKHHLVPFGEFIPRFFRWFTNLLRIPLGDFAAGDMAQPSFSWAGEYWSPNICYEDWFGEELAARFHRADTPPPTVLVHMSNLAWFGKGTIMTQHLHASRMRALELDRPMVRATNTGLTAIIDRHGRVTHQLPRGERMILRGQVAGNDGITFYAQWAGRWGLLPLWCGALALLLLLLIFTPSSHSAARVSTAARKTR